MATTITPRIVNLNATVVAAPSPSQLQQSGALVSEGGTNKTVGTYVYYGSYSAVLNALSATGNYTELSNMANTFFAQGSAVGLYILELGTQASADAGVAALSTWITNNTGVFYAYLCPAAWGFTKDEVGSVTITNGGSGYTTAPAVTISAPTTGITATATSTISNGAVVSVTITNPGSGYTSAPTVTFAAPTSGTTATGTANLASAINVLAEQYSSPTGKTYFFVTSVYSDLANYANNKAVIAFTPSPTAVSTEFQAATMFYQWLVNSPGLTSKLAPMSYRYVYGVTPWAQAGNAANINTVLTAYGNLILTGAEGGISTSCLFKGTTMDGEQASWWYGIDWFQIQVKQALAAAIINGSNSNPPLLYDQSGINTLQAIAQGIANSAVKFGCALSAVVTATSFSDYTTANPTNYNAGIYNGLSATVVGQNGFLTINFALEAVQFVI